MKTISSLKNVKKEEFKKDFLLRIFYSAMLDCAIEDTPEIAEAFAKLGLKKKSDFFYVDTERNIYVLCNCNTFSVCFEQNLGNSIYRQSFVNDVFRIIDVKGDLKVTVLSVQHHNRYVLSNFIDTVSMRKNALKFFFKRDFATDEEIIYKEEDMILYSKAVFSTDSSNSNMLDFPITACTTISSFKEVDFSKEFARLEKLSYKYWRTATTKAVLDEMRRNVNE